MHWSVSLIVMASLGAPESSAPESQPVFGSYTKAYRQANADHRPLLVVLNPARQRAPEEEITSLHDLQENERMRNALNDYVVAIIDTGSEHGKAVHDLFGSPALPRVIVIDERQDKQVFRSSEHLDPATFARVLEQHRTNAVVAPTTNVTGFPAATQGSFNAFQQYGTCPNCRRF